MNKSDTRLKQDIEEELRSDPSVNSAQIGVSVDNGAVSLLGAVDTYAQRLAAEGATKRVGGVRAVVQELTVKPLDGHRRTDLEIAEAIKSAFRWDVFVPRSVTATVHKGSVTLEGNVTWHFQRSAAERAIGYLAGIVDVRNCITLLPNTSASQVREKVEAALKRQATADAKSIQIETSGGKVTLTGHASSWQSIDDAGAAAWSASGVTEVINHLKMSMTT